MHYGVKGRSETKKERRKKKDRICYRYDVVPNSINKAENARLLSTGR